MKYSERIIPSILVSEFFAPFLEDDEKIFDAMQRVAQKQFYRCYEIAPIAKASVRGKIRAFVKDNDILLLNWVTRDLLAKGLNPSTLDAQMRKKTIARLLELVEMAAEMGAHNFAMTSCDDPGEEHRAEGYKGFEEVVLAVCEKLAPAGMNLYIEPLDRGAHKNNLLGPTSEAIDFIQKIRKVFPSTFIAWDSAHVFLNGEDPVQSIFEAEAYIGQFHLANVVPDKASPLYGDHHMELGAPGFLGKAQARDILQAAASAKLSHTVPHSISIEVRTAPDADPFETEAKYTPYLQELMSEEIL